MFVKCTLSHRGCYPAGQFDAPCMYVMCRRRGEGEKMLRKKKKWGGDGLAVESVFVRAYLKK